MTAPPASRPLRLVFAGTPETAVPALEALAAGPHDVVGVLTRDDAPLGRKRILTASPVARAAERLGIPVVKTSVPDEETTRRVAGLRPDLGVIVAYGALLREALLAVPAHGWINLHFSALPRWRGAAPVQRAIMAGDTEVGLDVFRLVAALDAGDLVASARHPLAGDETAGALLGVLAHEGAGLLAGAVDEIATGTARWRPQEGEPVYAAKLTAEDGRLRWDEPAASVYARLRAVTPEPGAYAELAGSRLKIHRAAPAGRPDAARRLAPGRLAAADGGVLVGTTTEPLLLLEVQPAGKRAMAAADWWRGHGSESAVLS